jgi:hypothetical protein
MNINIEVLEYDSTAYTARVRVTRDTPIQVSRISFREIILGEVARIAGWNSLIVQDRFDISDNDTFTRTVFERHGDGAILEYTLKPSTREKIFQL